MKIDISACSVMGEDGNDVMHIVCAPRDLADFNASTVEIVRPELLTPIARAFGPSVSVEN